MAPMVSLFQLFEFSYQDGVLFFDRSGALARRLRELFPGLVAGTYTLEQRDFSLPGEDLDLFFGIRLCRIQTLAPAHDKFPKMAASFVQAISEVFEITEIKDFRYRHVLGKPCASHEEAQALMWPMVSVETKAKLDSLKEPRRWDALQVEFTIGHFACQSRVAVIDMVPHRSLVTADMPANAPLPHITFHVDFKGSVPIDVADFDAAAFIQKVRKDHSAEILGKLAPHLV
ncbi:MAG: hypothetical protein AB7O66_15760 [Limisphaerales bacterium]